MPDVVTPPLPVMLAVMLMPRLEVIALGSNTTPPLPSVIGLPAG